MGDAILAGGAQDAEVIVDEQRVARGKGLDHL
jgi:hypothetical protein